MFEMIRKGALAKVSAAGSVTKALFHTALNVKMAYIHGICVVTELRA